MDFDSSVIGLWEVVMLTKCYILSCLQGLIEFKDIYIPGRMRWLKVRLFKSVV